MRFSLTGRAVPSCWAHRLTRSSSMRRAMSRTSSAAARAGGQRPDQLVVGVLDGVHAQHPAAVDVDVARQQLEAAADRGQVAGQVAQVGGAGAGDEAGRQQPAELRADVVDRRRLGRAAGCAGSASRTSCAAASTRWRRRR